jgi:predicted component of type VI protein secretion system
MRLSVQIAFDKAMDFETPKSSITIGRAPENDIVIPHDSVSRKHCTVDLTRGVFTITDLGSSNGTFVDGERLDLKKGKTFLSTSQIVIGKLDCEFAEGGLSKDQLAKAQSVKESINSNATTTIRMARLDIGKPSTLAVDEEKVIKARAAASTPSKRARNPITDEIQSRSHKDEDNEDSELYKKKYIKILVALAVGIAFLHYMAMGKS